MSQHHVTPPRHDATMGHRKSTLLVRGCFATHAVRRRLSARDDNSFLMLPETRLDEFAAALQAPNDELSEDPNNIIPSRYLAHVHKELLKLIMTDEETDRWWPSPKKATGPAGGRGPSCPRNSYSSARRPRRRRNRRASCAGSVVIQATGQPVQCPVPHLLVS